MRTRGSLLSWIVVGYALVSLPLIAALLLAQVSLNQLADHGERLINESTSVARLGGQLRDEVIHLERAARQYQALRDEALLSLFHQRVQRLKLTLTELETQALSGGFSLQLAMIHADLDALDARWRQPDLSGNLQAPLTQVEAFVTSIREMISAGQLAIERETAAMRATSERIRQRITFIALGLLPAAALALLWLLRRTDRSLSSLRDAINGLGRGGHEDTIVVSGPREFRRLGERLDWLRQRLHELESDKGRFLRHVSHELKTPLASVREAADLMGDASIGPLNPAQQELRALLLEASADLGDQIERLLSYAAWRVEQDDVGFESIDSARFLEDLTQQLALPAERKGLRLELHADAHGVRGQPNRLQEAAENLLANAVKYAPPDTQIDLALSSRDGKFELSVRDRGPGVPDNEKLRVFEPFARGEYAVATGMPGTGVGLSIVSECALAHGGEVFVEDANPGARFVFRWSDR